METFAPAATSRTLTWSRPRSATMCSSASVTAVCFGIGLDSRIMSGIIQSYGTIQSYDDPARAHRRHGRSHGTGLGAVRDRPGAEPGVLSRADCALCRVA